MRPDTPEGKKTTWVSFAWLAVAGLAFLTLALRQDLPWLIAFPAQWQLPLAALIDAAMEWFVAQFKAAFRLLAWGLSWPMRGLQATLQWLPWPATMLLLGATGYAAAGGRLALFTVGALLYVLLFGFWAPTMNTLALVCLSVPLSVLAGLLMGIAAFGSARIKRIVMPLLDVMQTFPTFAYLIPILFLFGFGPVVGLVASAIYATPPMVRNVILGLERVPPDIIESALMSGTNGWQTLWLARIPAALPTIMVGVNQTTMAAFSMVIIASVVGGTADIGWEVLSTMRKAQFGQSFLAGIVIALMAMVMDQTTRGFASRANGAGAKNHGTGAQRRVVSAQALSLGVLAGVVVLVVLARAFPPLQSWPRAWVFDPAAQLNAGVDFIITHYSEYLDSIKNGFLFYFLLPLRLGMENTVKPFTWGVTLSPTLIAVYLGVCAGATGVALRFLGRGAACATLALAVLYYFGTTGIPWCVIIAAVGVLAVQVGGWRLGLFVVVGLGLILSVGLWEAAMRSVYLCGAAVLMAFGLGAGLGICAAQSDRVSLLLRPVNDTLQTIPLFVFLIPVIMLFQIGDFPAMLAIVMYAIVPAIRYTEHGIRNVEPATVEAARALGCTRRQILWRVQLPLALPEIMVGLNQTIVFALAMLVVAALVGTKGLGQAVYLALNAGQVGDGVLAGLAMGIIAMIADRITQALSLRNKRALGLAPR